MTKNGENHILEITKSEQYKTVDELFKRSKSDPVYYTLLVLSVLIIASGLLLNNIAIVIGGMLVTPLLTPILVIALALLVGAPAVIKSVVNLMLKSFLLVIAGSFLLALIFGIGAAQILDNTLRAAGLYFIVALASGMAATFAWTRKDIAEILPGIAIAVSLVPPLSLVGIQLSVLNFGLSRFYLLVFLFNLVGIIFGSFAVFFALKFYKAGKKVEEKGKELEAAAQEQRAT